MSADSLIELLLVLALELALEGQEAAGSAARAVPPRLHGGHDTAASD